MTSLLDQMVASTGQQKRDKAATLTPVGTEKGTSFGATRIPDVPEVFLTGEALIDVARDLRRQADLLISVADGLDAHVGRDTMVNPAKEMVVAAVKAAEQKADTTFAEQYAAQQAAAQAATFAPEPLPQVAVASGSPTTGWTCPTHGSDFLNELTSRKGRKYRACEACTDFEK